MAKACIICGKKTKTGSNISHSHRVSKRKFKPNLQRIRIKYEGRIIRAYVCTKCLKAGKVEKV